MNMNWDVSYNNHRDYHWLETATLDRLLEIIDCKPTAKRSYDALDIGCGTGQLVRDLYHRGFRVRGIETSGTALKTAKKSTIVTDGISFRRHDIAKELLYELFDLITCKYVLAFIEDRQLFLKNVVASMKDGSTFVVISPDPKEVPESKQHIAFPAAELEYLLKEYFLDVQIETLQADHIFICKNPVVQT